MYNYLFLETRNKLNFLLNLMTVLQILNVTIMLAAWFGFRNGASYNHYDPETGEPNKVEEYPMTMNLGLLQFWRTGVFWVSTSSRE